MWIGRLVTIVCSTVAVAGSLLWVRSYRVCDIATSGWRSPSLFLLSNEGRVRGIYSRVAADRGWWPRGPWQWNHLAPKAVRPSGHVGIHWAIDHSDTDDVLFAISDAWIVGPPLVVLSVLAAGRWRRRLVKVGHCRCGYDLRATPDRCPECGRDA